MSRQAWVASGHLVGLGSESFVREERSLVESSTRSAKVFQEIVYGLDRSILLLSKATHSHLDVCANGAKKDSLCTTATSDTTTDEPTH